jgi:transposase
LSYVGQTDQGQTAGLCLDKGYDYASTREIAARLRLTLHLRTHGEEAKAKRPGAKARRSGVERAHSWINRFRRLLVRSEKSPPTTKRWSSSRVPPSLQHKQGYSDSLLAPSPHPAPSRHTAAQRYSVASLMFTLRQTASAVSH